MKLAQSAPLTSLVRLLARRPDVPDGAVPFAYHRATAPVMWVMVGLIVVELVVLHLAVPWPTARFVLVVLNVLGLVWVLDSIAGFIVNPHLLTRDVLTLRSGPRMSVRIPRDRIGAERASRPLS